MKLPESIYKTKRQKLLILSLSFDYNKSDQYKYFGWSMTIGLADSSDLWEEQLNDDKTQYLVDGEWRNLTKVSYEYKVAGKDLVVQDAYYTHRGLLIDAPTL